MFGPIKRKLKEKEDPAEKQREQEETARVYAEFVKSFQVDDDRAPKKFVRGGVIDPNKTLADTAQSADSNTSKSKFYKPPAKKGLWLPSSEESLQNRPPLARRAAPTAPGSASDAADTFAVDTHSTVRTELGKGIGGLDGLTSSRISSSGQRTREIDTFLEEIKRKQELVNQRKQLRQVANSAGVEESERESAKQKLDLIENQTKGRGSIPGVVEAEETTNLYLGNLSPEITEEFLCQQFGNYGNITSVKIMYPRSEEERARRRHCGFVSFENRDMAEAAKNGLDGEEFFGMPIRIGWGKAVSRPNLGSATPLTAGVTSLAGAPLPVPVGSRHKTGASGFSDTPPEKPLTEATIHVQLPKDRRQKAVIDIVAQYVVEDGYTFEQLLIEKERDNEMFKFLVEPETDLADYYRWRIYSFSQGDTLRSWRVEPYHMFSGGRKWHPLGAQYFEDRREDKRPSNFSDKADGCTMRDADAGPSRGKNASARGTRRLDEESREELEHHLRNLSRERSSILHAMAFCLDHSEYALEIAECLMESLTIEKTPIDTKISRLYLLSDILYNLSSSRQPAWTYRSALQRYLPEIFNHHNRVLRGLTGKLTIQAMKDRVMSVLRIWEDWAIYPPLFTKGLEASFLKDDKLLQDVFSSAVTPLDVDDESYDRELDGVPLPNISTLAKFPFWIRESVREWNALDLSHLEALCFRRGLSVSPEPIETGSGTDSALRGHENGIDKDTTTPDTAPLPAVKGHHRPDVSYGHMRQLLIKRLVECEAYWRNRQIQNAKAFQVLD